MQYSGEIENINPRNALGIRPYCSCCGGGEYRKGYSHTKAKSHENNKWEFEREQKRKRAVNSRRNRRKARPEKFND